MYIVGKKRECVKVLFLAVGKTWIGSDRAKGCKWLLVHRKNYTLPVEERFVNLDLVHTAQS